MCKYYFIAIAGLLHVNFFVPYNTFKSPSMNHLKKILAVLLVVIGLNTYAQVQIGATLTVSENDFAYGQNVQLSQDGKRLVVSGYGTTEQGVAVFDNRNGEWVEQPFLVASGISQRQAIYSAAMTPDGNTIAVGAVINAIEDSFGNVRIFQFKDNEWKQKGSIITGETDHELFGRSLAISNNGNRVIVGARLNSQMEKFSGRVAVYEFVNNTWSQLGQSISGIYKGVKIGSSVAISGDGNNIYFGSNSNYVWPPIINNYNKGKIEIRQLNEMRWLTMDSEAGDRFDQFGISLSVSGNGKIVATGATEYKNGSGYVSIYAINPDGQFEFIDKIEGSFNEFLGYSVALSNDGQKIVVGAIQSQHGDEKSSVTIFEYNGNEYLEIGQITENKAIDFGTSVAMSADGSTIAVGALTYDFDTTTPIKGAVTVYDISDLKSPDPYVEEVIVYNDVNVDIIVYPSPATTTLNCSNCESVSEWHITDITGKKVLSSQNGSLDIIDVSGLQTGIYYAYLIRDMNDFVVKNFIKK